MKMRILTLGLFCLFIFISCESPMSPDIEEILIPPKALIVRTGTLTTGYFGNDMWGFRGYVKNIGKGTGYNCMITIQCFSDSSKTIIIDTAKGFPANLGNIAPGQEAYFEAISFQAETMDDITFIREEITWLDR